MTTTITPEQQSAPDGPQTELPLLPPDSGAEHIAQLAPINPDSVTAHLGAQKAARVDAWLGKPGELDDQTLRDYQDYMTARALTYKNANDKDYDVGRTDSVNAKIEAETLAEQKPVSLMNDPNMHNLARIVVEARKDGDEDKLIAAKTALRERVDDLAKTDPHSLPSVEHQARQDFVNQYIDAFGQAKPTEQPVAKQPPHPPAVKYVENDAETFSHVDSRDVDKKQVHIPALTDEHYTQNTDDEPTISMEPIRLEKGNGTKLYDQDNDPANRHETPVVERFEISEFHRPSAANAEAGKKPEATPKRARKFGGQIVGRAVAGGRKAWDKTGELLDKLDERAKKNQIIVREKGAAKLAAKEVARQNGPNKEFKLRLPRIDGKRLAAVRKTSAEMDAIYENSSATREIRATWDRLPAAKREKIKGVSKIALVAALGAGVLGFALNHFISSGQPNAPRIDAPELYTDTPISTPGTLTNGDADLLTGR